MVKQTEITESQVKRLREFALEELRDAEYAPTGRSIDFSSGAILALSEHPDDGWKDWREVTDATEHQWFVWRNPENPDDKIHADYVGSENGRIVVKASCGVMWYTECQACRFPQDVLDIFKRVAAKRSSQST